MDIRQILINFKYLASASNGVKHLREVILFLAFQGSLLEHLQEDNSDLFASLEKQRANFFPKESKPENEIDTFPKTFQTYIIPKHWRWLLLSEVGHDWGQKKPDTNFTYIDVSSIDNQHGNIKEPFTVLSPAQSPSRARKIVQKGTIIYSTVRPYLLNVVLISQDFIYEPIASTAFAVIHTWEGIVPKYVYYYLRSPYFVAYVQSVQSGIAYPAISNKKFFTGQIPIPPTIEQERIVAKVDELMALCDKLEAQQQKRDKLSQLTCNNVLQRLGDANTSPEINDAWYRIKENIPLLLNDLGGIQNFKNAILDLAMSGSLLAHNELSISTGFELLAQIAQHRKAWEKSAIDQESLEATRVQKKLKNQRLVIPKRDIPENWSWGSLLQIAQAVVDCHNKTAPYVPNGIHIVRTSDIRNGHMNLKDTKKISEDTYNYWTRRLPPQSGDVFFTREAPMGEAAIVPEGEKVCLGQRTMLIRLFPELINNKFLLYAIYSPSFQERMKTAAIGITVKHLRVGDVEDLLVPVPPKVEQDRIVAIVDALFAICNELENNLLKKNELVTNLARASIESIIGIRTERQEKMKFPKTELISNLHLGSNSTNGKEAPLAIILGNNNGKLLTKTLWKASGLEIDAFYQQLKKEMAEGWIVQPETAYVKEVEAN